MQAGFESSQVQVMGRYHDYLRVSDEADRKEHVFHFCPDCGSSVFYTEPDEPELVVVATGAFADPSFPPPARSGYDSRRHPWVQLADSIGRFAPELWWDSAGPLYDAGDYAGAAAKGRELVEQRPDQAGFFFNTACCESLAGERDAAIAHLRRAIELWDGCRALAAQDSDLDAIRDEPEFRALLG